MRYAKHIKHLPFLSNVVLITREQETKDIYIPQELLQRLLHKYIVVCVCVCVCEREREREIVSLPIERRGERCFPLIVSAVYTLQGKKKPRKHKEENAWSQCFERKWNHTYIWYEYFQN